MTLETRGNVESIKARAGDDTGLTNGQEDISGGVETDISDVSGFTIYLNSAGAVDVTVEYSPDGGTNWYEPRDESPVSFSGANTEVIAVAYQASAVRLTGSNTTGVEAQVREVV